MVGTLDEVVDGTAVVTLRLHGIIGPAELDSSGFRIGMNGFRGLYGGGVFTPGFGRENIDSLSLKFGFLVAKLLTTFGVGGGVVGLVRIRNLVVVRSVVDGMVLGLGVPLVNVLEGLI